MIPKSEPIGTVSAPCDEKVWRNMELQAKADGRQVLLDDPTGDDIARDAP